MDKFTIKNLDLFYGDFQALKSIHLALPANEITAFIGQIGRASCRERVYVLV